MPKGEALRQLPPGTRVTMTLRPDGTWAGTLAAGGTEVEAAGPAGAGPQAVVVALARAWLSSSGDKPPSPGG